MARARAGTGLCVCAPDLALFFTVYRALHRSQTGDCGCAGCGRSCGAPYDLRHVWVAPGELDGLVKRVNAAIGGQASKLIVTNVLPAPRSTEFQYVWTPARTMSLFAFETTIPFPFGAQRTRFPV